MITLKKCFIVKLSGKIDIPIDEDELLKVLAGIKTGGAIPLKQGIIANPNFIISIVPDEKRIDKFLVLKKNLSDPYYFQGDSLRKERTAELQEMTSLPDIFASIDFKKLTGEKPKQLN